MIEITAREGAYRKGLLAAADHLSPEETAIISDLERNGLRVSQLHDVLCGGHVLIDDPRLYEAWRFTNVSHLRISSHHRDIDKARYPDIGMRGQVVREKLHGRTAQGTWVHKLEKTPAAFGKRKLPTLNDIRHLMDYVDVAPADPQQPSAPGDLSAMTERRPMYLSPATSPVPMSLPCVRWRQALTLALGRMSAADDTHRGVCPRSGGSRFRPPGQADPANELGQALSGRAGRGLFGSSKVWVTETPVRRTAAILGELRAESAAESWRAGARTA